MKPRLKPAFGGSLAAGRKVLEGSHDAIQLESFQQLHEKSHFKMRAIND